MLQYVDGFSCAITENLDTVSIKFVQHEPFIGSDEENQGKFSQSQINEVVSVVMTSDCAKGLLNVLSDLVSYIDTE